MDMLRSHEIRLSNSRTSLSFREAEIDATFILGSEAVPLDQILHEIIYKKVTQEECQVIGFIDQGRCSLDVNSDPYLMTLDAKVYPITVI